MLNKCYRNYRKSFVQFEYSKITKLRNILCFFISRLFFQTKYTKKKQAIRLAGIHSTYIQYFSVIVNDFTIVYITLPSASSIVIAGINTNAVVPSPSTLSYLTPYSSPKHNFILKLIFFTP